MMWMKIYGWWLMLMDDVGFDWIILMLLMLFMLFMVLVFDG